MNNVKNQAHLTNQILAAFDLCSETLEFSYSFVNVLLLIISTNPRHSYFKGEIAFTFDDDSQLVIKGSNKKISIRVAEDDQPVASESQKPADEPDR